MKLSNGYIKNLDGIRALAVLLVVVSHFGLGHIVPDGFGVTLFFFLSGYLITTLLLTEYENEKHISIKNLFARRALGLFLSLMLTLSVSYFFVYIGILPGDISLSSFIGNRSPGPYVSVR